MMMYTTQSLVQMAAIESKYEHLTPTTLCGLKWDWEEDVVCYVSRCFWTAFPTLTISYIRVFYLLRVQPEIKGKDTEHLLVRITPFHYSGSY